MGLVKNLKLSFAVVSCFYCVR